jgi:hypothetical protein
MPDDMVTIAQRQQEAKRRFFQLLRLGALKFDWSEAKTKHRLIARYKLDDVKCLPAD